MQKSPPSRSESFWLFYPYNRLKLYTIKSRLNSFGYEFKLSHYGVWLLFTVVLRIWYEIVVSQILQITYVFQFYNLVNNLTAKENVELATQICAHASQPEEVLKKVGLEDRMNNFPSQLSGGEQQRVSIARALAKNPKLLLCDEPTGALDYNTGKNILRLLQDTCRRDGVTVIVITHNSAIAPMADRVITVKNSKVDKVEINKDPVDVQLLGKLGGFS